MDAGRSGDFASPARGLDLSGSRPRLGSPTFLENRFESEGRSHAFNLRIDEGGSGRIFALSGTELVEGRIEAGRIVELRLLNLSKPVPRP